MNTPRTSGIGTLDIKATFNNGRFLSAQRQTVKVTIFYWVANCLVSNVTGARYVIPTTA